MVKLNQAFTALLALLLFSIITSAKAAPLSVDHFTNDELEVKILSGENHPAPARRGNVVTFAAEITFKQSQGQALTAGTQLLVYWTIMCDKGLERHLIKAVKRPHEPLQVVSEQQLLQQAPNVRFTPIMDPLSVAVANLICAEVK
jgi:hypothetical protein